MRDRLDQLSRDAIDVNERFKVTEDKLVSLYINVQSMLADGFSESHR